MEPGKHNILDDHYVHGWNNSGRRRVKILRARRAIQICLNLPVFYLNYVGSGLTVGCLVLFPRKDLLFFLWKTLQDLSNTKMQEKSSSF